MALWQNGNVHNSSTAFFILGGHMYTLEDGTQVDGLIDKIKLPNGKVYALQCKVIEAHPITCPKCGGTFELAFGRGKCDFCGTYFTTEFKITPM